MAARNGRVVALGSRSDLDSLRGPNTTVLRLPERAAVLPGWIDAHAHLVGLALPLREADLRGCSTPVEMCERTASFSESWPERWVVGRGWDQNLWSEGDAEVRAALETIDTDRPVFLIRVDGHAAWCNRAALELAGIDRTTPDPPGGRIGRAGSPGAPNGLLVDRAMDLVRNAIPKPSVDTLKSLLLHAQRLCHETGLTGVHDAGLGNDLLEAYRELAEEDRLRLRTHAMLGYSEIDLDPWWERGPQCGSWLQISSIKVYMDGALGSRGAALLEPYSDDPGNRGLLLTEPAELLDLCIEAFARGWQVCVHAIGDRANRLVLDTYEEAFQQTQADPVKIRPRIEHAQILDPVDVERFASLGVVASIQPTHCTSDQAWAPTRLGPRRMATSYLWNRLKLSGARIALGSDFPIESPDPRLGLYAAATRLPPGFEAGPGSVHPECLSFEEALMGYTHGAAWASRQEEFLGGIFPGGAADFVVLDRDPTLLAHPEEIFETRILATIVSGEIVHRS